MRRREQLIRRVREDINLIKQESLMASHQLACRDYCAKSRIKTFPDRRHITERETIR